MGVVDPEPPEPPGARYAMSIVHPGGSTLRVRYRQGVLFDPYGFPDWTLCARAVVDLPPRDDRLTSDEQRVADVLAANAVQARPAPSSDNDPLWTEVAPGQPGPTPAGWCWVNLPGVRRLALVPIELHGAFRHAGGRYLAGPGSRGLRFEQTGAPVGCRADDPVPDEILDLTESLLGWPLPPIYRSYLAATNGAGPAAVGVLPGYGFVADQPLFGLARDDRQQDLTNVGEWVRDRLSLDFLPIGFVQGGLLVVRTAPPDVDSVWYLDDDDPRDDERLDADRISSTLLQRCADSINAFWAALVPPPSWLVGLADYWVAQGLVVPRRDAGTGAGLPGRMRAAWQSTTAVGADPLAAAFETR